MAWEWRSYIKYRIDFLKNDAKAYPEEFRKRFYIEAIKSDIRDSFSLLVVYPLKKGRIRDAMAGMRVVFANIIDYILARLYL